MEPRPPGTPPCHQRDSAYCVSRNTLVFGYRKANDTGFQPPGFMVEGLRKASPGPECLDLTPSDGGNILH